MANIKFDSRIVLLWFILALPLAGAAAVLNLQRDRILKKIGHSVPTTAVAGGDEFLEIHSAYQRLLARFHQAGAPPGGMPALLKDPDFLTIQRVAQSLKRAESPAKQEPAGFPLGLIASDALWMAGQRLQARSALFGAADRVGLSLAEKNLLTPKRQNRESNAGSGSNPEESQ